MKNEIEIIDGVKGEWRTVTKASEVKVGQRVKYGCYGKSNADKRIIERIDGNTISTNGGSFIDTYWNNLLAFFPMPVRSEKRKVAKVRIYKHGKIWWLFETRIKGTYCAGNSKERSHAIRGARRFCKAIGYECEIVKEVK